MRTVTKDTITQAFLDYCEPETDDRLKFILDRLVHHLHDFVRETDLSHEEWSKGLEFLRFTGEMTDDERNEFVLLSDVLGLSSLVDMVHSPEGVTPSSVLGPFHILGAPDLAVGGDLKRDNEGATIIVEGKVTDPDGNPIAGAEIEIWQTADNGLYSNQDNAQPEYNLRGHMTVGDDGVYKLTTVRPAPYTVPIDGSVGEMLKATGRHPWRPSHLHFIITAPGYRSLVTEVFPSDDPYLDNDAVFGVREKLIMEYVEQTDKSKIPAGLEIGENVTMPFFTVDFDFVLGKEES
jgi:hydroxyquinol 1,2-dioxygenase